jgi:hypothetical protein
MQMHAYIRVCGDESTIRALHDETKLPHATIKQLKAKTRSGDAYCWNWQTERVSINVDDADGELKRFLNSHRRIFPAIKKHRKSETDIYLQIITKYQDGEDLRGLYLSAETIALLGELGGAVDNDVEAYGLSLRKS